MNKKELRQKLNLLEEVGLTVQDILEMADFLQSTEKNIERRAKDILLRIGMNPNLKGYHYICEAAKLAYLNKPRTAKEGIYEKIADVYDTTWSCVERGIRNAVEETFRKGNLKELEKLMGTSIDWSKGKVTNTRFIAIIVDRIKFGN